MNVINRLARHKIAFHLETMMQYIIVLCLILDFYSVYICVAEKQSNNALIRIIMIVFVLLGVISKHKLKRKNYVKSMYAILGASAFTFIWYVFDPIKSSTIFMIFVQIITIIIYILLVEDSFDKTMQIFSNIVTMIAIVSLLFWMLGSVLGLVHPTDYVNITWTGNDSIRRIPSYFNLYYETQSSYFFGLSSSRLIKNTAIFSEAPMASMVFSLAFTYEMLVREEIKHLRCFIIGLAIVSTMSTTGLSEMVLCSGMKYLFTKAKKGKLTLKVIIVPVIAVISSTVLMFVLEEKLESVSGLTRVDDFIAGYKAWMENPLFGNGYGNLEPFLRHISSFRLNNQGLANSIFLILVYGGIYLFIPYLYALLKCTINMIRIKDWKKLSFFIIYLLSFSITMCSFRALTYYMFLTMMNKKIYADFVRNNGSECFKSLKNTI